MIKVESSKLNEYKLLDSGNGQKLEEVGSVRVVRSEPRAWWNKSLGEGEWAKADAVYDEEGKQWTFNNEFEKEFAIKEGDLSLKIKFPSNSKHIGIFPEQAEQWKFIKEIIKKEKREVNVLNLFGYTGASSLAAASAGAKVTHVDGSRTTISWARENQALSGLEDKPIRWILDDALAFVKRELKRGVSYDAIILDPPAYGRGPKGEVWKVEESLPELLEACAEILSDKPLFVILNMYQTELSSISLKNLLDSALEGKGGETQSGELTLPETSSERLLPLSIFARWTLV